MKKKIVMLLLLLTTFFLMGTMSAMADTEEPAAYVQVDGRTFEGDGEYHTLYENGQDGFISFSGERNMVILEDLILNRASCVISDYVMAGIYIKSEEPITICLVGDCQISLECGTEKSVAAIYADCPSLTICGYGNLTVSFDNPQYTNAAIVTGGALTIDNTTVIANEAKQAVSCSTLGFHYGTLEGAVDYEDISEWVFDETVVLKGGETKDTLHDCESVEDLQACYYVKIKNPQYYNVAVNGVELSEKNPSVKCGDGEAYVKFNPDSSLPELYLENATITKGILDPVTYFYAGIVVRDDYCVLVSGDTEINLEYEGALVCGMLLKDNVEFIANDYLETQRYGGTKLNIHGKASEGYGSIGIYAQAGLYLCALNVSVQDDYALVSYGQVIGDECRIELSGTQYAFDSSEMTAFSLRNSRYGKAYGDTENSDGSEKQELEAEDLMEHNFTQYKYLLFDEKLCSEVFVNGEEFTPEKTEIKCGNGTATYDFEKNELTLENVTITLDGTANLHLGDELSYKYDIPGDLDCGIFGMFSSLVLKGTNTIVLEPGEVYDDTLHIGIMQPEFGFNEDGWTLTVSGTGTLDISLGYIDEDVDAFGVFIGFGRSPHRLVLQDWVSLNVTNVGSGALESDCLEVVMKDAASLCLSGYAALDGDATINTDDMTASFFTEVDYEDQEGHSAQAWNGEITGSELYLLILAEKSIVDTVDVLHANTARDGLTVTWEKADEEMGYTYRLLRREHTDGGKGMVLPEWDVLADQLTVTGYYDKTAEPGVQYEYAVQLCIGEICGEAGNEQIGCYMNAPTIATVENRSGSVRVNWTAVDGADGYYVYRKDTQAGTWHFLGGTQKNLYFIDSSVEGGTVYYYAIKSFKKVDENIAASASGPAKNTIYVKNNFISKLSNQYSGILKVEFSPSPNCTGYEIVYGTEEDLSDGLTVPVKMAAATDKSITNLKKGTTYYVKIRAYKTMGGYTFYSNWSAVKELTLTK